MRIYEGIIRIMKIDEGIIMIMRSIDCEEKRDKREDGVDYIMKAKTNVENIWE